MLEGILKIGPFLAGIAALIALIVTATATARLRRQEELLREAAEAVDPPHRDALKDRHRWVLSRILARQVCGWWRFTWPWLVWAGLATVVAQSSYVLAERLSGPEPTSFNEVLATFIGSNDPIVIGGVAVFPFVLIPAFTSLEWSLSQRASIARQFYETGVLHRFESRRGWEYPRGSTRWESVGMTLRALVPGLAAFAFGLFLGVAVFGRRHSEVVYQDHPGLWQLNGWAIMAVSFFILSTMLVADSVRSGLEPAAGGSPTHPPSNLILPRREG